MTVGYFPSENGMARITAVCVFRCSVPWRFLDSVEKQRVVDQRTASARGQDRSGRQITDPQLFDAPRSSPIDRYALQFNISIVLALAEDDQKFRCGGAFIDYVHISYGNKGSQQGQCSKVPQFAFSS